jgi:hypothetical protein
MAGASEILERCNGEGRNVEGRKAVRPSPKKSRRISVLVWRENVA